MTTSRTRARVSWFTPARRLSTPGCAAAARASDLAGLPPTYIEVGELDLFRDESLDYAIRLLRAGVPTELHTDPGAYHAFDILAPRAAVVPTGH